jgi:hypothetical protein
MSKAEKTVLTLSEFARAIRRSEPFVRKQIKLGRLKVAPGRPYRIAADLVGAWNRGEIGVAA